MRIDAPLAGVVHSLSEVPDPVFSQQMLGPGLALMATEADTVQVLAPLSGHISALQPHAFFIQAQPGVSVLIHLGLDLFHLSPSPFISHVELGQTVKRRQAVITWNLAATIRAGIKPWVMVSVLGVEHAGVILRNLVSPSDTIPAGQTLMEVSRI